MDKVFLEQMKKKVARELAEREVAAVEYWRQEIDKLAAKKSESLAALQQDLKGLVTRMDNRLKIIRTSADV